MPTPQQLPLASSETEAQSPSVSLESLTNLYLAPSPGGGKSPAALYGTPGLKLWGSAGDGPGRGIIEMGAHLWVVSGNTLFKVDASKVATAIGTIEGAGSVHMTHNGSEVAIAVPGGLAYAADATGVYALSESRFNGATAQDGYGIFSQENGQKFFITGLDNMKTINPLDFGTADSHPDYVKGIISDHRELVVFGEKTTEFFYNSGAADFPFERAGGGFIEHGLGASGSPAKVNNTVLWLDDNFTVRAAMGYQAQSVSPPWVETMIANAADPTTGWAWTYRHAGRTFYSLNFSDLSLCYDMEMQRWHRRKSDGMGRWRASGHAYYRRKHIMCDVENGNLYELDLDTYDENGAELRRELITPPIHADDGAIMDELLLDMQMGIGLVSGQGSDPNVMLDWTDDDGRTWSTEIKASAGQIGKRKRQARWNRLGEFECRSLRFAISDPVKVAILGLHGRLAPLGS